MAESDESRFAFLRDWDEDRVLPVIVVSSEAAALDEAVRTELEYLIPRRLKAAWINLNDLKEVPQALARCRGAEFRSQLDHPLWETEPPWCFVFGEDTPALESLAAEKCRIVQLADLGRGGASPQEGDARGMLFSVDSRKCPAENLGLALAAFMVGAWRRYCHKRDGNISGAFLTPGGSSAQAFTLGIGIMANGAQRHVPRWHGRIMHGLLERMGRKAPPEKMAEEMPLDDLVQFLLPPEGYSVGSGADSESGQEIVSGPASVHLVDRSARLSVDVDRLTRRDEAERFVCRLRDRRASLHVVTEPGVEAYSSSKTSPLEDELKTELAAALRVSPVLDGVITRIGAQLKHCHQRVQMLQDIDLRSDKDRAPFSFQYLDLLRKLAAIPNTWGLCARVSLVAVGLIWLLIAGMIWGDGWNFSSDATVRWATYAAGFALLILIAGAASFYWYANFRACKALSDAEEEAINEHLDRVAVMVKSGLGRVGASLSECVGRPESHDDDTWFSRWRKIVGAFDSEGERWRNAEFAADHNEGFFSAQTVDRVVGGEEDKIIEQIQEEFFSILFSDLPESVLTSASYTSWLDLRVKELVEESFDLLTINQLLEIEGPDRSRIERTLHDLVETAKTPIVDTPWHFHGSRMFFFAPTSWQDRRGTHSEVEVVDIGSRCLMAVSVHVLELESV